MKGGAPSLIALLGKPKSDDSSDEPSDSGSGGSDGAEKDFAREAFGAMQDGDEEGFISAFLGAVKACVRKSGSSDPTEPDEDDVY